jgi:hypothetical protein
MGNVNHLHVFIRVFASIEFLGRWKICLADEEAKLWFTTEADLDLLAGVNPSVLSAVMRCQDRRDAEADVKLNKAGVHAAK